MPVCSRQHREIHLLRGTNPRRGCIIVRGEFEVSACLETLQLDFQGQPYNKSERRALLIVKLNSRLPHPCRGEMRLAPSPGPNQTSAASWAALAIRLKRARLSTTPIAGLTMLDIRNPILWLIGVIALGVVLFLVRGHFSAEARERRRREKSHRPVISRKQGPTVRLAVDVGKRKRKRKG
jgi:hypothetical protein